MTEFANINEVAAHLRHELRTQVQKEKNFLLVFAYNGTGKTRLSMAFKNLGKNPSVTEDNGSFSEPVTETIDDGSFSDSVTEVVDYGNFGGDTLYFNAFTEDLFNWDNDLDGDSRRVLKLNSHSRFFAGLQDLEMDTRIRPFLHRYVDFDFVIDYENWEVNFTRIVPNENYTEDNGQERTTLETHVKVSRGEENIFIWCFFLAIAQLAMDKSIEAYKSVKYIYIDDPVSSLDDNNIIAIAHHLAQLLKTKNSRIKVVVSTHHALFFNIMWNEFNEVRKKSSQYFLSCEGQGEKYVLTQTGDTPFFHHVATLIELYQASESGELNTHHFNTLRTILEKSASFHGYKHFSALIKLDEDDEEGNLQARLVNVLNHGNYSLYEPKEMLPENKAYFKKILDNFLRSYPFNPELFPETTQEVTAQ